MFVFENILKVKTKVAGLLNYVIEPCNLFFQGIHISQVPLNY